MKEREKGGGMKKDEERERCERGDLVLIYSAVVQLRRDAEEMISSFPCEVMTAV